jgi:hypothetical protein
MAQGPLTLSHPTSRGAEILPKAVFAILLGVGLLTGIGSVGGSFLPFALLHNKALSLSATGQIPFFTFEFYHQMQLRLRLMGAANIGLALLLLLFRRHVLHSIGRILADFKTLGRDVGSGFKSLPAIDLAVLAGLVMFAAGLRISLLTQSIRYDEASSFLQYASHPFYAALSFYDAPNNHLLNTLLMRVAYLAFGNQPWALRLPTLVAGVCLVPAAYIAALSLYRSKGALLAAGLVVVSSVLIEYSTYARGYSMVCLAFLVMIPLSAYALRNSNWAVWLLFAVVAALGFYAIPIMLYPFGGVIAWLLLCAWVRDGEAPVRDMALGISFAICLTGILTVELYGPVLAVSGPKSLVANKWVIASPLPTFLHGLPLSLASTWRDWNRSVPLWLSLVLAAGFFVSLLWHRRIGKSRVPLLFGLILWIVPVVCAQRVIPFERVWLFALPLYFVISAAGIAMMLDSLLERRHWRDPMIVVTVSVGLFLGFRVASSHSAYLANDCRGLNAVAAYLKGELKPGDSVVAALPSDVPLYYYFRKEGVASSFINAPSAERRFVVVNEATGDTVDRVLDWMKVPASAERARLLVKYESAALYELPAERPAAEGR